MEAVSIVFDLHGKLLRHMSVMAGIHFTGLQQAVRHRRRIGAIDAKVAKRLLVAETTFNV